LTVLNGRSEFFASFLAMARYSLRQHDARECADRSLDHVAARRMNDQAVLASAPPLSLTSASVMTAARW
jgi:hypothetical protein